METAWINVQWKVYSVVENRDETAQVQSQKGKASLEVRKWTGTFSHALFYSLTSEARGQAHVLILPSHSFHCWIKIYNVRKFGTLKRLHEDVRLQEIAARKKRLKFKVNELWWKCEIEELRRNFKANGNKYTEDRRGNWLAGN